MSDQKSVEEEWGDLPSDVELVTEADETEADVDMDELAAHLAQVAEEQGITDDEGNDEDQPGEELPYTDTDFPPDQSEPLASVDLDDDKYGDQV